MKAALQYYDATNESSVLDGCLRFVKQLKHQFLPNQPLFSWGQFRWADFAVGLFKLYDITNEKWLLEFAHTIKDQGYDWDSHFQNFQYTEKVTDTFGLKTHVVNSAMAIKTPAVLERMHAKRNNNLKTRDYIAKLDHYHGQVTGVFTGDEHYAGMNPSQGTETCAVVEYMYSLEVALETEADLDLMERLEKITFNALPASLSPDMKWHQYDQQVNQVLCDFSDERIYTNNDPDSNMFGLEPNFGCCTANLHQGWPKFTAQLWRQTDDHGLAAISWAPCTVRTEVNGNPVRIEVATDYPFKDEINIHIKPENSTRFPVYLRVPEWSINPILKNLTSGLEITLKPGTMHRLEEYWLESGTDLELKLPAKFTVEHRFNDSIAFLRGNLVYAHPIQGEWKPYKDSEKPLYSVRPKSDWNWGIDDFVMPEYKINTTKDQFDTPEYCVFSESNTPVKATTKAKRVANWSLEWNSAGVIPSTPEFAGSLQSILLIPYGCTTLRVTEFPADVKNRSLK